MLSLPAHSLSGCNSGRVEGEQDGVAAVTQCRRSGTKPGVRMDRPECKRGGASAQEELRKSSALFYLKASAQFDEDYNNAIDAHTWRPPQAGRQVVMRLPGKRGRLLAILDSPLPRKQAVTSTQQP